MESIIAAAITGLLALVGVVISNHQAANRMAAQLDKQQAVTNTEIAELTREVREHNNFARRVPVMEEQVKVINHRLDDLEEFHKPK